MNTNCWTNQLAPLTTIAAYIVLVCVAIGFMLFAAGYAYEKFTSRKIVKRKVQRAHKRELL